MGWVCFLGGGGVARQHVCSQQGWLCFFGGGGCYVSTLAHSTSGTAYQDKSRHGGVCHAAKLPAMFRTACTWHRWLACMHGSVLCLRWRRFISRYFCCCLSCRPEMVVGWYHSHPGFGCWLSGVDINTQQVRAAAQPTISRGWAVNQGWVFGSCCCLRDINTQQVSERMRQGRRVCLGWIPTHSRCAQQPSPPSAGVGLSSCRVGFWLLLLCNGRQTQQGASLHVPGCKGGGSV
jgi:hypothetical protein